MYTFILIGLRVKNIYIFGGVSEIAGERIYTNDLWKYSISTNTWTKFLYKKIASVQRDVMLLYSC
jgi:Kelch motif.